jgi:rod shape determining protein RodA
MYKVIEHLKRLDWILLGAIALVFLMGLMVFYSNSLDRELFYRQAIFGIVGFVVILSLSFFDWRILKNSSILIIALYTIGIALLFVLFAVGSKIRGVTSWFRLGAINFEPVELVKIILVIVLAKYFSSRYLESHRWKNIFISGIYVLIPAGLVMIQPDLGSAIILSSIWFGMILMAGIKARQVLLILFLIAISIIAVWNYGLKDYQQDRITSFLYPERDPLGGSYQSQQAIIAIGSGGFLGKGLGQGTQTRLGFLPEYQTDFIFGAIAEELGLFGILILLLGWIIIFSRFYKNIKQAADNFSCLFMVGISMILLVHFLINIGANIGFLPITGLPLPFVSYGGSNLLSLCIGIGIVQSIKSSVLSRNVEDDSYRF